jgi:hypothetical protein
VIAYSGLTEWLRRTAVFKPLALIGRHSLPVFATGCVLVVIGEVIVETRPEEFTYQLALGAAIALIGALIHYAVAVLAARHSVVTAPLLAARSGPEVGVSTAVRIKQSPQPHVGVPQAGRIAAVATRQDQG